MATRDGRPSIRKICVLNIKVHHVGSYSCTGKTFYQYRRWDFVWRRRMLIMRHIGTYHSEVGIDLSEPICSKHISEPPTHSKLGGAPTYWYEVHVHVHVRIYTRTYMYMYIYIYIYVYVYIQMCMYIYIYMYICIYIYIYIYLYAHISVCYEYHMSCLLHIVYVCIYIYIFFFFFLY